MKLKADLTCPGCKSKFEFLVEMMVPGKSTKCAWCGATIAFTGNSGRELQRAVDNVHAAFKKLGR